jgi:CUG-BP- and ETR3-like factor
VASPLQVKYADGEMERLEHKLFIGMLPRGATKTDVMYVFAPYGNIKELSVIKGSQPTSKGSFNVCSFCFIFLVLITSD